MNTYYSLVEGEHPLKPIGDFVKKLMQTPKTTDSILSKSSSAFFIGGVDEFEEAVIDDSHFFLNPDILNSPIHIGQQHILHNLVVHHQEYYEDYKILYLMVYHLFKQKKDHIFGADFLDYVNSLARGRRSSLFNLIDFIEKKSKSSPRDKKPTHFAEENKVLQELEDKIDELLLSCYFFHVALEKVYFNYLGLVDDNVLDNLCSQGVVLSILVRKRMDAIFQRQNFYLPLAMTWDKSSQDLVHKKAFVRTKPYRNRYDFLNLCRLFLFRLRRFVLNLNQMTDIMRLSVFVNVLEPYFHPFLQWLNFLFFIPRLSLYFFCALKHIFFPDDKESLLSINVRLQAQWNRRWEFILRDLIWWTNGILNLFVLTGVFSIAAFYFNVFFQLLEVSLNLFNLLNGEKNLDSRKAYVHQFFQPFEGEVKDNGMDCIDDVCERLNIQHKNMMNRLLISIGILLSNILILPVWGSFVPVLPLIGAAIGILMSFCQFYNRMQVDKDNEFLRKKPTFETKVKFQHLIPHINNQPFHQACPSNPNIYVS